ncbi:hypothetical protein SFRURICE_003295 [Spodoptera frugiperda]|nr:hypothetical protein SFRURICE_003295 [Spodoptera frugiperda]
MSEDPLITPDTVVSGADGDGLRASWRTLHVYPDDYPTHRGYLALRCRATIATRPPHVRSMSVRLYVAARPHISSYMFSKNNDQLCKRCCNREYEPKFQFSALAHVLTTQTKQ